MKEDALFKIADEIKDQLLKEKVISLLKEPRLTMIEGDSKSVSFTASPASKRRHPIKKRLIAGLRLIGVIGRSRGGC